MTAIKTLGDFLREEMRKRDMSIYSFGDFVGLSHSTIYKFSFYGEKEMGYPNIEFLVKIAEATQTDIRYLISLVVPEAVFSEEKIDPAYLRLSERISKLPPDYQQIIETIIDVGLSKASEDKTD